MATYVTPSAIVHEVLKKNNYKYWSACMKSYLEAQDLWETISSSHSNGETQSRAWKKKNSAALHAIQISCGPEFFSEIENISLAKRAWETLANKLNTQSQQQQQQPPQLQQQQQQQPQSQPQLQQQQQPQSQAQQQQQPQSQPQPQQQQQPQSQPQQQQQTQPQPQPQPQLQTRPQQGHQAPMTMQEGERMMSYIKKGDWKRLKAMLNRFINARIGEHGGTALHYAVKNGHLRVVRGIITMMDPKDLEIKDSDGSTALMYAALAGITEMARCMIRKNEKLGNIANEKVEHSPLSVACMLGHKETAKYLYTKTSIDFLSQDNGKHASRVLMNCIYSETIDIALDLLRRLPDSCKVDVIKTSRVLVHLSKKPGAFPSGIRLVFWKRWIYSSIHQLPRVTTTIRITDVNPVLRRLCILVGHVLDILPGIRQIGDLKHVHVHSVDLVNCICTEIKNSGAKNYKDIGMYDAFASATKLGISELVLALCEIHNDLFDYDEDGNGRNLLMLSIVHRQEKLFDAISSYINRKGRGYTSVPIQDKFGNTMLHLAGLLSPSSQLARISGAALQMQRELQWYKQVESIMNPIYKQIKNEYGETPKQVFTNSHKELMAEGEKWMKDTATSCTVVGALIITIMFNAAFIGARHYIDAFPLLSPSASFRIFIMADAISLFASSTSVLTFLGIRTMRYAEEDFSVSLPAQLIIGLSSLILSLATMMIAFCASLFMILHEAHSYVIPIIYMAPVPVSIFMFSQFSLLKEVAISTFGWNVLYQMSSSFKWKLFFRLLAFDVVDRWNRICLKLF